MFNTVRMNRTADRDKLHHTTSVADLTDEQLTDFSIFTYILYFLKIGNILGLNLNFPKMLIYRREELLKAFILKVWNASTI